MESYSDEQVRRILSDEVYLKDLVENAFTFLDFDKSGYLDPSEVKYLVSQYKVLDDVDIKSIIRNFDTNRDGKLGKEEFTRMFRNILEMILNEP